MRWRGYHALCTSMDKGSEEETIEFKSNRNNIVGLCILHKVHIYHTYMLGGRVGDGCWERRDKFYGFIAAGATLN